MTIGHNSLFINQKWKSMFFDDVFDVNIIYDIELHGTRGEPICVKTRSNHCNGPFKCNSIQHGVLVTV